MRGHTISLLGIPYDLQSSYRRGAAHAPEMIRRAWFSPSSNLYSEDGTLVDRELVNDLGDMDFQDEKNAFARIEEEAGDIVRDGSRVVFLGGDHSITYPIIKAFSKRRKLNILQVDAHPDLYDVFEGNRLSHACPFARIMEENLAKRLVQVGVRTMTAHHREQAERFEVEVHDMISWRDDIELKIPGPLYVSLDVDSIDPAFAPGVSHREPGGLSTRQVIRLIQSIKSEIVGADIVEYNPSADIPGMTDMVCAKLLKELAAKLSR